MTTTPDPTPQEPVCLWTDDDIVNAVYQLTYKVTDASALAQARAMMYKMRDELNGDRQRLTAELADTQRALAEARAWEVVDIDHRPSVITRAQFRGVIAQEFIICRRTSSSAGKDVSEAQNG